MADVRAVRTWVAGAAAAASLAAAAPLGQAAATSDCTSQATRSALASFVSAFNRGDAQQLDSLFAQPPLFQWYSSNVPGLRNMPAAQDRNTLITYFRARHVKRDRMRLVSFSFTGNSHGAGNFIFKMKRAAGDYRNGAWFGLIGKGAAVCSDEATEQPVRFVVLSLGGPGSDKR
jgi:hypothetical protein